jgi:NitT/TauT family transport system substrate-binding protein
MSMRIGHLSTAYHTALIISGAGWGRDLGLEWRLYPTGPAMIESMEEGSIDAAYMGLPPAMIGIARGMRIKCVAGGHVEGTLILGRKEHSPVDEHGVKRVLQQFNGGAIGVPAAGSIHDIIVRDLLQRKGLEGKVRVKNYPWADQIVEALEVGDIDGAAGTPSLAGVVLQAGIGRILIPPGMLWPYNPSYGIVVREELIQEKPELLMDFLRLHRRASRLLRESPGRASGIVAGVLEVVDEGFVHRVFSLSPRYCTSLPRRYVEAAMAFVPVMCRLGYLSRPLREEEVFHRDLIKQLHPEKPHY